LQELRASRHVDSVSMWEVERRAPNAIHSPDSSTQESVPAHEMAIGEWLVEARIAEVEVEGLDGNAEKPWRPLDAPRPFARRRRSFALLRWLAKRLPRRIGQGVSLDFS